jgi:hypothetical protein
MAEAENTGWIPQWRIVSTVPLNQYEKAGAENWGCVPQLQIMSIVS